MKSILVNNLNLVSVRIPLLDIYTVKDENLCSIACFWSKTTLIPSSVSGAGVNPPFSKVSTFFLRSLALSVPIRRNFQSNGVKWQSFKP